MELLYFLRVLFRKKWIILSLTFLAVLTAFFFLVNKKPNYISIAQYSTGFTAEKVRLVDGSASIDLYTADVKFDNVIETIKSPQVINRISYRLLLHDLSEPLVSYIKLAPKTKESDIFKQVNIDTAIRILRDKLYKHELLRAEILKERLLIEYLKLYNYNYESLLEGLSINRVQRTDYLDILFRSENAELSAWVVNAVGNEFLNYYKNLNSKRTDENAQSISEMVEIQQKKVDSLNQRLLDEKISQGAIDPTVRTTGAMETVTELETRLADEKRKYNEHYNRLSYLNKSLHVLQSKITIGSSNEDVLRLTNKKNELVAALAKKGGNDADLEKQINDLRNEISIKSNNGANRNKLNENLDDLNRQISEEEALMNASNSTILDFSARIRRYMGLTNIDPGSGVKMDVIKTQLENENKQLSAVKEKYIQAQGLSKDDPTSNFIQTRIGQPAGEPESKKTLVKMGLSGIVVFFLTAVLFIFLEIFDSSVKTPAIFNKLSKVKITSVLNSINFKKLNITDVIMEEYEGKKYLKQNVFKNNVRKIRYELLDSGKQIFIITSTQKNAGKTSVIEALAASLLLSKKRVLIIDLNFHNNSLTTKYNATIFIQEIPNILSYNIPISSQQISYLTQFENLQIIGCIQGNYTPTEALYNIDMFAFMELLKAEYDFILIESAALNYYSDSKELAKYVQGMFIVFAADHSLSQVDYESLKFLSDHHEINNGVILNKVMTENINS